MATLLRWAKAVRNNPKKSAAAALVFSWGVTAMAEKRRNNEEIDRICEEAKTFSKEPLGNTTYMTFKPKRYIVLQNSASGPRNALSITEKVVQKILHLSAADVDFEKTYLSLSATEILNEKTLSDVDGIVCVGGDGLLQEAMSAVMHRSPADCQRIVFCHVPCGTANSLPRLLFKDSAYVTSGEKVQAARMVMGLIKGAHTAANVMSISTYDSTVYALGYLGWSMPASMLSRSQVRRWPGDYRYDLGFFLSVIRDWKHAKHSEATLAMRLDAAVTKDGAWRNEDTKLAGVWEEVSGKFVHFLATFLPSLFLNKPIDNSLKIGSGYLSVTYVTKPMSAFEYIKAAIKVASGTPLAEIPGFESRRVKELTLTPRMPSPRPSAAVASSVPSYTGLGCPNRANPHHECSPYCATRWGPDVPVDKRAAFLKEQADAIDTANAAAAAAGADTSAAGGAQQSMARGMDSFSSTVQRMKERDGEDTIPDTPEGRYHHEVDYAIDGGMFFAKPIHVRVLPQTVRIALPDTTHYLRK